MDNTEFFRNLSAKYGLPLQFVIKEFHVMDLLAKIVSLENKSIVFKGGTALNRCYAQRTDATGVNTPLSRFSEDLDFDYISSKPLKSKIKELENLMNIGGYKIEKPRLFRNRLRFDCFFTNEMGKKDVVRAEFNLSFSKIVGKAEKKTASSEISGKTITGVNVYSLEGLMARKLLALHNRTEGKDIFDLANFIEKANSEKTVKSLNSLLKYEKSKKSAKELISECIEKLDMLNIRELAALTNNYIPVSLRPEWHLTIENLKMKLETLIK